MLEQLKLELVGQEITLNELDNKMMENGFYSNADYWDEREVLNDSNAVFTAEKKESLMVEFDVTIEANEETENLGASYIKITSVEIW